VLAGEAAERGRTPVLIIDEAHLLDHEQLESIRMLTNHEMDSSTPFATVLVGQPTLRHNIKLGVLAALDQRITVRYQMKGMTGDETASYIRHTSKPPAAPPTCSPTTPSPRSTRPPAASPVPSTTSPSPP
jgi:type II secretory pathway predicted ATPase ExeA